MTSYGQQSEQHAAQYLTRHGHKIITTNFQYYGQGRGRRGEIDIITIKDNVLHFVEVKARRSTKFGHPLGAITPQKVQLLRSAAEYYLLKNPQYKKCFSQFDAVCITDSDTQYFERAF